MEIEKLNMSIQDLRRKFINYQDQFYRKDCMYAQIAQSDQYRCINAGSYDEYLLDDKNKILLNKVLNYSNQ